MVWTENNLKSTLSHFMPRPCGGRQRRMVGKGRGNRAASADPCTRWAEQAGNGGPGPEEPPFTQGLEGQALGRVWGDPGGDGGDCALALEGIHGILGPSSPNSGAKTNYWESLLIGRVDLRVSAKSIWGEGTPGSPPGAAVGPRSFFCPASPFCCSLLWQTLPGTEVSRLE